MAMVVVDGRRSSSPGRVFPREELRWRQGGGAMEEEG
jgi:hypothetical protein